MTWSTRFRLRQSIRQSLWLVPLVGAVAGLLLARAAQAVGQDLTMPDALTFTPSTASAVLTAIIGAMIGLVGFVVTVTVLLVQTSTSQFSARYMRLLYRDRLLKAVLAVLVGTFAYAFVLLRRVGDTEVPHLGIVLVFPLVLAGVVLFLLFLSRILQRLRPAAVAATVSRAGIEAFRALERPATAVGSPVQLVAGDVWTVASTRSGAIQAVWIEGLADWARRYGCTLTFQHGVGDFVHPLTTLVDIQGAVPPPDAAREIQAMVALGRERTIEQDPGFAIRVMVDVANRALSAAINDPTTAVQVLDYIEDLLLVIGRSDLSDAGVYRDPDGTSRIVLPARDWPGYLTLAVTEIRRYGADSVQVVRRLRALFLRLHEHVRPEHRAAVIEELGKLDASVRAHPGWGVDLDLALTADPQGLGGVTPGTPQP
jgi:uncharacterized membrane protein